MIDLSVKRRIQGSKHFFQNIDQLYHPTGIYKQDSEDLVYGRDIINSTKFVPILLKEWFALVEPSGYLVIDYQPNEILDWQTLEEKMWWLWKGKYEIVYHGPVSGQELKFQSGSALHSYIGSKEIDIADTTTKRLPDKANGYLRFVCKKTDPSSIKGDTINRWTFGIITNGKRADWLEKTIKSIRDQKVPEYEIIICGTIPPRHDEDIKIINFYHRDDLGWITRKKNIIAKEARYENLCIVHDRLVFEKDWFKGMKKWGNNFDHLSCVQKFEEKRINDWEMHEALPGMEFSFVSLMDYRDWDWLCCEGGQLHILKKHLALKVLWNETYYWGRPEDLRISNDLRDIGAILRFNPWSSFQVMAYRFGTIPSIPFDSMKLSRRRIGDTSRLVSRAIYGYIYKYSTLKNLMIYIFKKTYNK